jgi:hemerythrin-like metal-binding protein
MISWTPSFAIGVPEIDAQHRALFEHATRLEGAVTAGEPNRRLDELFGFLKEYAVDHFEAEERLMRETEYPGLMEQVRQHADFNRRLRSLVPHWESEGGSTALLLALTGALDLWLRDHVTSCDQRFGDFLRDRGSSATIA